MKRTITYTRAALVSTKQFENTRFELTDTIELENWHPGGGDAMRDELIRKVDELVARKVLEAKGLLKDPQQVAHHAEQEKTRRRNHVRAALKEAGFSTITDHYVDSLLQS